MVSGQWEEKSHWSLVSGQWEEREESIVRRTGIRWAFHFTNDYWLSPVTND